MVKKENSFGYNYYCGILGVLSGGSLDEKDSVCDETSFSECPVGILAKSVHLPFQNCL